VHHLNPSGAQWCVIRRRARESAETAHPPAKPPGPYTTEMTSSLLLSPYLPLGLSRLFHSLFPRRVYIYIHNGSPVPLLSIPFSISGQTSERTRILDDDIYIYVNIIVCIRRRRRRRRTQPFEALPLIYVRGRTSPTAAVPKRTAFPVYTTTTTTIPTQKIVYI